MTRWSQLKKAVESLFAEKMRGRVELRATSYGHDSVDKPGRGSIAIDGEEVWSFCSFVAGKAHWDLTRNANLTEELYATLAKEGGVARGLNRLAYEKCLERGLLTKWEYYRFLFDYLSMPHASALQSDNIIFLAMAILDRRLGKRRIPDFYDRYQAHPLLKRLYDFRCEVEGVVPSSQAAAGLGHGIGQ